MREDYTNIDINDLIEHNVKIIHSKPEYYNKSEFKDLNNKNINSESVYEEIFLSLYKFSFIDTNSSQKLYLTALGKDMFRLGGWKEFKKQKEKIDIENSIKQKKKEEAELENLITSTKVNKWFLKTKWLPHSLSAISIIVTFVFGYLSYTSTNEAEAKQEAQTKTLKVLTKRLKSLEDDAKLLKIYPKVTVGKTTNDKIE